MHIHGMSPARPAARCPLAAAGCASALWRCCWQPPRTYRYPCRPLNGIASTALEQLKAQSRRVDHTGEAVARALSVGAQRGLQGALGALQLGGQRVHLVPQQVGLRIALRDLGRLRGVFLSRRGVSSASYATGPPPARGVSPAACAARRRPAGRSALDPAAAASSPPPRPPCGAR
eukprot:COSAG01_NODE_8635_length_2713_cov_1.084927_3_plen_175_part_00